MNTRLYQLCEILSYYRILWKVSAPSETIFPFDSSYLRLVSLHVHQGKENTGNVWVCQFVKGRQLVSVNLAPLKKGSALKGKTFCSSYQDLDIQLYQVDIKTWVRISQKKISPESRRTCSMVNSTLKELGAFQRR